MASQTASRTPGPRRRRRRRALFLCLALPALLGTAPPAPEGRGIWALLDPLMASGLRELRIPGAVVALVVEGRVVLTKGYGFADLERRVPADPVHTVFPVGSVAKVVTATAVLQLVESGHVALDDDVNRHLRSLRVPDAYPEPVTLRHLLTHTAGFDEDNIGIAARSWERRLPLARYLAEHLPPRVRPPGRLIAYSNHGMSLAGLVVEEVSGVPFPRYVAERIFAPLGMAHSSFELPAPLAAALATGYELRRGALRPVPYDAFHIVPAASLVTTAADMARFMLAQLEGGSYGGGRILEPETLELMHRRHFGHDPRVPGFALGLYERLPPGLRALEHGGGLRGYSSHLLLVPGRRLGLFVAANRLETELNRQVVALVLGAISPRPRPASRASGPAVWLGAAGVARGAPGAHAPAGLVGSYRPAAAARGSFEKLATLFEQYRVTVADGGSFTLEYPWSYREPSRWVRVGDGFYLDAEGDGRAVLQLDGGGRVVRILLSSPRPLVLERLPWHRTRPAQLAILAALLVVLLSACLPWPWPPSGDLARHARRAAGLVGALDTAFVVALGWVLARMELYEFVYGLPVSVAAVLVLPLLSLPLTALLPALALLAWRRRCWSLAGRLHYTAVALAAVGFVALLGSWNLLGFRS